MLLARRLCLVNAELKILPDPTKKTDLFLISGCSIGRVTLQT